MLNVPVDVIGDPATDNILGTDTATLVTVPPETEENGTFLATPF
jgi:hypothetical protein